MAVEACSNPNMYEDEDDELPLIFKRTSGLSKQAQLNAEVKKSAPQNHDRKNTEVKKSPSLIQEKRGSAILSHSNGQSSNGQKNKILPSAKRIPSKPPVSSPEASTSSGRAFPVKSTSESLKGISSPLGESKTVPKPSVKVEKSSTPDSENSGDLKPLISRYPSGVSKGSSNSATKGLSSSIHEPKVSAQPSSEDSEDDLPLSSRCLMKSNTSVSAGKSYASDERKPPASKLQQNGSVKREEQRKSPPFVNKRSLDKVNSSTQSSIKKPKISDSAQVLKNKNVSMKSEQKHEDDDEDDVPISHRMKKASKSNIGSSSGKKATKVITSSFKKTTKKTKKVAKNSNYSKSSKMSPSSRDDGQKWSTFEHHGVIFPPPYKPHGVKMLYNKKPVVLTPEQEEVATMFAVMLDTEYAQKEKFVENFMADWRKILGKNHVIQNFKDCDFTPIYEWHQKEKEKKKQMSTEEKKAIKEEKMKLEEKYMWAVVDGVKEKVGNFRVEPPGLFRGRGEHPKMGKLKRRIYPSDITINIGKNAPIPECPIPGESWKEVRHDNTVTWLAYWTDPINQKEFKYVFLAPSSSLKGQSDKEKYEKARTLKDYIGGIRAAYTKNFNSQNTTTRQIAVATYLIDKLALRAGNEKDDDEADTVGCCTLKVENVTLLPGTNTLRFDFLGKDSIRYEKDVEVEPLVYKAIRIFQQGKKPNEDLFDQLDTSKLNAHLKELMPGLTAKVFRTYNASITLDEMLNDDTKEGDVPEKVLTYQRANKEVAIICNHQRTVSKSHTAQISKLDEKIDESKKLLDELKTDLARAKKGKPPLKDADGKQKRNLSPEALQKKIDQTNGKIERLEQQKTSKEDLKTVALGTSKINYLDPRISVAWCKRHEVPIEKIFNKSLLEKFSWAMDVDPSFRF